MGGRDLLDRLDRKPGNYHYAVMAGTTYAADLLEVCNRRGERSPVDGGRTRHRDFKPVRKGTDTWRERGHGNLIAPAG